MSKEKGTPEPEKEEDKTSKNETQESDTPKKDSESDNKSDELKSYKARMEHHQKKQKDAEEEVSQLREQISSSKEKNPSPSRDDSDIDRIMDITQATKDLDKDDITQLKKVASADDIPLSEARESELFRGYLKIKEEKVAKDKETPEPDSRKAPENKGFSEYTQEDLENLSTDELFEYVQWEKKAKS